MEATALASAWQEAILVLPRSRDMARGSDFGGAFRHSNPAERSPAGGAAFGEPLESQVWS